MGGCLVLKGLQKRRRLLHRVRHEVFDPGFLLSMSGEDSFRYRLWATVESLRYWAPAIADVARVDESETTASWSVVITPYVARACPMELTLKATRLFDMTIAGESYRDRSLDVLDFILPLIESVTEGRVIQRKWVSVATGAVRSVETIVTLEDGSVWTEGRTLAPVGSAIPEDATERHDRHFLPYRR
jgi:hypothetical protein